MGKSVRDVREHISPDIIKMICDEVGYSITRLSHEYGRASNYFDANQISKRGGLRPPEGKFLRAVWKKKEVPEPGYFNIEWLRIRLHREALNITDMANCIGRSHSYFSAKRKDGVVWLCAGDVMCVSELIGCSWEDLKEPPISDTVGEVVNVDVDEFADVYTLPPAYDNGMDVGVVEKKEEREQITLLSTFSNEELIAEVLRRMNK